MIKRFIRLFFLIRYFPLLLRSSESLLLEIRGLRRQVRILMRKTPRPKLKKSDRVFWVILKRCWSGWQIPLLLFKPKTILDWHRQGFRLFWRLRCRSGNGEPNLERKREIRSLIIRLAMDNLNWGAPRIHGEMRKLGFRVSERTVSRYMPKRRPSKNRQNKWLIFLHNHRHAFAAMDFFTVPTIKLQAPA